MNFEEFTFRYGWLLIILIVGILMLTVSSNEFDANDFCKSNGGAYATSSFDRVCLFDENGIITSKKIVKFNDEWSFLKESDS